jgi:hypothetical protein
VKELQLKAKLSKWEFEEIAAFLSNYGFGWVGSKK